MLLRSGYTRPKKSLLDLEVLMDQEIVREIQREVQLPSDVVTN